RQPVRALVARRVPLARSLGVAGEPAHRLRAGEPGARHRLSEAEHHSPARGQPMKPFRVLVVDDSPLNRSEIVMCLTGITEVEVVGAAADGSEALRMARDLKPDAITLDLEMPKMDGFTFLRVIPDVWLCPVLVISSHSDSRQV